MDYEKAIAYALRRLENELDPVLTYHSAAHTRDDVMVAVEVFAEHEQISAGDLVLLRTAAAFHDLGYVEQRDGRDHEKRSILIARKVLPDYGYTNEHIDKISGMIMATKVPQQPSTLLEALIVDADLDSLGRPDYFIVSNRLRRELLYFGTEYTDTEWYRWQLDFLSSHQYFTAIARKLRDAGKASNIEAVGEILSRIMQ